jgi:hypothetical protein
VGIPETETSQLFLDNRAEVGESSFIGKDSRHPLVQGTSGFCRSECVKGAHNLLQPMNVFTSVCIVLYLVVITYLLQPMNVFT